MDFACPPVPAGRAYHTIAPTFHAYRALLEFDSENVGTPDYLGMAWFWDTAYAGLLRDVSYPVRAAVHDALIRDGLDVRGRGPLHTALILQVAAKAKERERHQIFGSFGTWKG
jgi:hypothetical protein